MDELSARVLGALRAAQVPRRGDRLLVGVSGGPDSVALLFLLHGLTPVLHARLIVVHIDHQLRETSARDAEFVRDLAARLTLPSVILTRDVRAVMRSRRLSLEDAARQVRYDAFLQVALQHQASGLALAHTADDQAETVLMRLLRGAGLTGLMGIPATRVIQDLTVVRPLLGCWRAELLAYLHAQKLSYRHDATNDDPRFLRNRIRHQLLPLLRREYNPNISALFVQLAEQCRTDAAFLQQAARRLWKRLVRPTPGQLRLRMELLLRQPEALQRQLIRMAITSLQGDLTGFEFRHWVEIQRLFSDRPVGTIVDLPGGIQVERGRELLTIRLLHATPGGQP